jgi:hypothetical protein
MIVSAVAVLDKLAANPWLLFAVAFAGNAVLMPYHGLYHDAVLYAGQVLHSADGRFANDLFFKYGSQNDYTYLPRLLAPLAVDFGVEPVFFVAYLLSNALRLAASQMLVFRLFGRSAATAAGILLIAIADVPVGCSAVFRVNEPFFTARVPALALSILGLERLLAGRYLTAGVCLLLGLAAHPLMAFPATAIAVTWAAWEWATTPARRGVAGAAGVLGLAAVGGYLARTAGSLDAEWLELVMRKNSYLDPLAWWPIDTLRLLAAIGCVVAVGRTLDPPRRRFLWVVLAAAVVGYLVAAVAVRGSWSLLLQGQAYRAVWVVELLGFPAGMLVVAKLWTGGPSTRVPAVAVLAIVLAAKDLHHPGSGQLFAGAVAVGVGLAMLSGRSRSDPAWLAWAMSVGLGLWMVLWYAVWVPVELAALFQRPLALEAPWALKVDPAERRFGPLVRLGVALPAIGLLLRFASTGTATGIALAFGLVVSVGLDAIASSKAFEATFEPRRADHRYAATVIAEHWHEPRMPTVYWPFAQTNLIWVDMTANSYVSLDQLSGITFSRECARESFRRFQGRVFHFEVDETRRIYGDGIHLAREDMSPVLNDPPASVEDFRALVAEPDLDFLVLPRDFGGSVATNGRVWVYDCRKLRAAK